MKTEKIDEAIEMLTKLRIECVKGNLNHMDQKLYEIETKLFKFYDDNLSSDFDRGITITREKPPLRELAYLKPEFRSELRRRRIALGLSPNKVYSQCGIHPATLLNIENPIISVRALSVKKLDDFYTIKEKEFFDQKK
ncbi:MAG: XRE family transcriptional regulator [Polynucleobacter sp.]|nr:MAG: XRE family transcriptional regulator [Polynucleobacter sp.]